MMCISPSSPDATDGRQGGKCVSKASLKKGEKFNGSEI